MYSRGRIFGIQTSTRKTPEVKIRSTFQFQISSYFCYISKRRKKMEKKEINGLHSKIGSVVVKAMLKRVCTSIGYRSRWKLAIISHILASKRRKKVDKKKKQVFYPKIGSVVVEGNVRGIVERPRRTVIRGTFFVGFRSLYNACSNFSF